MKKLAFLIISLLVYSGVHAQLPFSFGPKAGFTTTKLTTNKQEIKEAFTANPHGGLFVRLGNKSFLQPEVIFTTKGGLFNRNDYLHAREIELSTVEIPLLVGSKILNTKAANIRMMAGPSISFILDKEITMRNGFEPIDVNKLQDAIWGLQAGIGIDFLMLTLDIRYEWGLNNLSSIDGISMYNSLFNVSFGWKIL